MTLINQLRTSCFFLHCPIFSVTTSCTPPSLHRHNHHTHTSVYKKTKLGTKEHMATTPYHGTIHDHHIHHNPNQLRVDEPSCFSHPTFSASVVIPLPLDLFKLRTVWPPFPMSYGQWAKTRSHVSSWKFDHIWKSKRLNMGQFKSWNLLADLFSDVAFLHPTDITPTDPSLN